MATDRKALRIKKDPKKYWYSVGVSAIPLAYAALQATYDYFSGGGASGIHLGGSTLPFSVLAPLAASPYYYASTYLIDAKEFFGIYTLERPAKEGRSGLVYAPRGYNRLERLPRAEQQDQFPGEPEQIRHMSAEQAQLARSELLEPMFITTGGIETDPKYADELKYDAMNGHYTFEPTFTVTWQVELDVNRNDEDEGFFEFALNISGNTWEEKYRTILKRMRDAGEEALGEIMAAHSAAWCIKYRAIIVEAVKARIRERVTEWGIVICEVTVLNINGGKTLSEKLGNILGANADAQVTVTAATAEATATTIRAGAEKERLIKESEGLAQAAVNAGEASGTAYAKKAEKMGMKPEEIFDREIASTMFGKKTVVFGGDGVAQMMAAARTALKSVGGK
jgi:hypothetical protein